MEINGIIQVRIPAKNLRNPEHFRQGGSEVTVRIDPEVYAQARLRKAVANAVAKGYTLTDEAKAELVEYYKFEAAAKKIRK